VLAFEDEAVSKLFYPDDMIRQLFKEGGLSVVESARKTLLALVDTVFFASLSLEEGQPVRVAIVHEERGSTGLVDVLDSSPPEHWAEDGPPRAWDVAAFDRRPFEPRVLAKFSRGLKYGTQLAVVGGRAPNLWIDGIARRTPGTDGGPVTRIAAPRPGVIVFEERGQELLRYDAGRRIRPPVDILGTDGPLRHAVAAITADVQSPFGSSSETAIMKLVRRMRATGMGGIFAMLPATPHESVLAKVRYRRADVKILADRIRSDREKSFSWFAVMIAATDKDLSAEEVRSLHARRAESESARDALDAAVDDIAQLSSIDGALLAGPHLEVYGGGYLIPLVSGFECVSALDAEIRTLIPHADGYGARHQAAFSFAYNNPGGVAFVVSEDGPVSCALRIADRVVVWQVYVPET
jgi:hypothetical protein